MRKILIVDDEELIRNGLKAMVQRYKENFYEIYLCSNGKQAKELLDTENIDIMITDIRMPELNGIDLINHLKNTNKATAIIILSGYDDFQYAREAIRCGAKEYLLKPVNREKLYSCLEEIEKELAKKEEYDLGYYSNLFNSLVQTDSIPAELINAMEEDGKKKSLTNTTLGFLTSE